MKKMHSATLRNYHHARWSSELVGTSDNNDNDR